MGDKEKQTNKQTYWMVVSSKCLIRVWRQARMSVFVIFFWNGGGSMMRGSINGRTAFRMKSLISGDMTAI